MSKALRVFQALLEIKDLKASLVPTVQSVRKVSWVPKARSVSEDKKVKMVRLATTALKAPLDNAVPKAHKEAKAATAQMASKAHRVSKARSVSLAASANLA